MASFRLALLLGPPLLGLPLLVTGPAQAGPVVCTSTFEAPASAGGPPQEVTRCGALQTTPELVDQRFFRYTAPFAEGVSLRGQVRELFGVATGSINSGDSIRAFGFPDQTMIWDGTALENTYGVLLEAQSDLQPWRTADITNGFGCSLGAPGSCGPASGAAGRGFTTRTPVRGLW